MRKFIILGELIKLDEENKTLQVGDKKPITFDLLDEYVKEFKNVNRIHIWKY